MDTNTNVYLSVLSPRHRVVTADLLHLPNDTGTGFTTLARSVLVNEHESMLVSSNYRGEDPESINFTDSAKVSVFLRQEATNLEGDVWLHTQHPCSSLATPT